MSLPQRKRILTMNRGSASLKSFVYDVGQAEELALSIALDQVGASHGRLKIADASGKVLLDERSDSMHPDRELETIFDWLVSNGYLKELAAVGHRIVHGGPRYRSPHRVTPVFISEINELVPLDPDHMPATISGIQFITRKFPDVPQFACFDTAFHSSLPIVARTYALPRRLFEDGIVRYGFHGLSYEYIMQELRKIDAQLAAGRVIVAHLGSGASMAALKDGKSVDTSMGFTPLEGLVMSTRSGDVDPGVLLYLLAQEKLSPAEIDHLLNKESGLLGVSVTTADMRQLLERAGEDRRAAEAIDLFCYRAKKYVGAYAAALGGLDGLVFTGGIGERAAAIRERICEGLEFLGVRLDDARNTANAPVISSAESRVNVRVMETNEDLMIVRHVTILLDEAGLTTG